LFNEQKEEYLKDYEGFSVGYCAGNYLSDLGVKKMAILLVAIQTLINLI